MDEKFGLLNAAKPGRVFRVLDLGAAPGSWSLYIMRKCSSFLVSVDLAALSRQHDQGLFDKPEFLFIQGDFTQPEIREAILSHGPYNLIVSDAAPATSGKRSLDADRSLALAETVLDYGENVLASRGNLVIKLFQGGDSGSLLKTMRGLFETGRSFKPKACRPESFETYYLGLGKK